jgi:hypothetical protein
VLEFHAGGAKRHYQLKHPDEALPKKILNKNLEYRQFRRAARKREKMLARIDNSNAAAEPKKKTKGKGKPHHTRKAIPLKPISKQQYQPFTAFLQTSFGGSCALSYAQELAVIFGKVVAFERKTPLVITLDDDDDDEDDEEEEEVKVKVKVEEKKKDDSGLISDDEIDEVLSDLSRYTRLFTKLEVDWGCRAGTLEKWMQACLKAARWRIHRLTQVVPQTPQVIERMRLLGLVDKFFNDYNRSLSKKKHRQQRQSAQSVEERTDAGNWCSSAEWKKAVEQATPDFMLIIKTAKKTPLDIDNTRYQAAMDYCLALFYCENRPTRPGFLTALTIKDWEKIKETGSYSTREFKTTAL